MHRKQILTRQRDVKEIIPDIDRVLTHEEASAQNLRQESAVAREHLASYLRGAYPKGFFRVLVAPDGRLRILVVDDQFNGVDFVQKHKYVLDGLNRAVERRELAKADLARVSSIDVYSPKGLV